VWADRKPFCPSEPSTSLRPGKHQMKERTPQQCPAVLLTPAHLASIMIDEPVTQLDSTRIKPLIDALKIESGHGGGGFMVRGPPPPPQLFS
jgi:hypothetical protein